MKRIVLILPVFLAACGGHVSKAGITQEQLEHDKAECYYEGTKAMGASYDGVVRGEVYNQCLYLKGYR